VGEKCRCLFELDVRNKWKSWFYKGNEYFIQFNDFDATVGNYREINVKSDDKGSSIITLAIQGPNKSQNGRIFECHRQDAYKRQLDGKNQFANTIAFIDSTLVAMESQLKETGNELKSFRKVKIYTT
jgi:hypothetical protein